MKILIIILISLLIISCSSPKKVITNNSLKKSSMNDKFMEDDLNVKLWQEKFENRDRDVYKNREKIVKALKLKNGDVVADVGAGTGFFLKLLHDDVIPDGQIFAVELSPKFVEFIKARVKAEKLQGITVVKSTLDSTTLASNSLDKIFVCDTFHHFDNPQAMIKDFFRALRPDGELIIVDFDKVEGKSREWILKHIKMNKAEYIKSISTNFFTFSHESKIGLEENFMLHFKKNTR